MNIPELELQEFLKEYAKLAFPEQQVQRADLFCHRETRAWLTVFVTGPSGNQLLMNAKGEILGQYEQITPLFVSSPAKFCGDIEYLLEQLSCLRSRVPPEHYEKARLSLEALSQPVKPLAATYFVLRDGLLGVVDPTGRVIVPPQYETIEPFALTHPGEAVLFLCRANAHQLNSTDVYDIRGNGIFRQIGKLLPREETLLTPPDSGVPLRKTKSLWVIHQSIDHPFPEEPDFQSVQEAAHRYTLKALRSSGSDPIQLAPMEDRPVWEHFSSGEAPVAVLLPLAATIGEAIDCPAETVLHRLGDYRSFQLERTPPEVRLAHVTRNTPIGKLGLSICSHHCLVRNQVETVADLLPLAQDTIARWSQNNDRIIREISLFQQALENILSKSPRP